MPVISRPTIAKMSNFHPKVMTHFCVFKVQLFWEGHKNVRNRPYGFEIYLVNVKTMRTIAQIFVAFSEKLNFNHVIPVSSQLYYAPYCSLECNPFSWLVGSAFISSTKTWRKKVILIKTINEESWMSPTVILTRISQQFFGQKRIRQHPVLNHH